jgi:uncharacterized membrane protein
MKNFSRFFGITALAAVIVLGLAFTSCEDTEERVAVFTNNSNYAIAIVAPGSTPSSFTLEKWDGKVGGTQTVTRTGKDIEFEWTVPSMGG